jgi:hypothetical protein
MQVDYADYSRHYHVEIEVVFFDKLVTKGLLRAMVLVSRRTLPAAGFPAGWLLQHYLILATRCLAGIIKRQPVLRYSG